MAATAAGKMYWADLGTDKIQRANLNGSGVEDLVTGGLVSPYGLALDVGGGKMYWTDFETNKIQRANLDGSGMEDLVSVGGFTYGLALDAGAGKMYWTDWGTGKIQRANLDGSGVVDLVTSGLRLPTGLALDLGDRDVGGTDDPSPPPPVRLSASPASIERGRSATLTWSSTRAASAEITPGIGVVRTPGSRTGSPSTTTTYRITVRDAGG